MRSRIFRNMFCLLLLQIPAASVSAQNPWGQINNNVAPPVNNPTAVPVPGVGHDYIHDLSEIVNPANGSLSVRIEAPRPKERAFNYPLYSFMYDSTQQFGLHYSQATSGQAYHCGMDTAGDNQDAEEATQPLTCILNITWWYQSLPLAASENPPFLGGPGALVSNYTEYSRWYSATYMTCYLYQGFTYEDPYGVTHNLGAYGIYSDGDNNAACNYLGIQPSPIGGDEDYKIVV